MLISPPNSPMPTFPKWRRLRSASAPPASCRCPRSPQRRPRRRLARPRATPTSPRNSPMRTFPKRRRPRSGSVPRASRSRLRPLLRQSRRRRLRAVRRLRCFTTRATPSAWRRWPRRPTDSAERSALEWASLRADAHPSFASLAAFFGAHPGWPSSEWIRDRQEAELAAHAEAPAKVAAYFAGAPPHSSAGKIAAARAANAAGRADEAARIVRALWRDGNFNSFTESLIIREFGASLAQADHKYRADRLFYAGYFGAATRAAAFAGPDVLALANGSHRSCSRAAERRGTQSGPAGAPERSWSYVRQNPVRPARAPRL